MVGRRDEDSGEAMVDVTYRQSAGERQLVAVMQKIYLCASTEFLMAITDFFLQALSSAPKDRLALKQATEPQAETKMGKNRRGVSAIISITNGGGDGECSAPSDGFFK